MFAKRGGFRFALFHADPAFEEAQGIVPKRVDFDRLAASGRDDPAIDFRVHPGKLIALLALFQKAVARIDGDAELGAAQMMLDDVAKFGQ